MGGKSSTTTSKTELPPQIMQAYTGLLDQATPISKTPYQAYTGGVDGTGMAQDQLTGFNSIANLDGSSDGDFSNAAGALGSTATPTSASVGQYMSPYLSQVAQTTMANMNEQNAEQQQGVIGNAAAQGALGGNRVGVAQAELARQQNLANQSTIANLYNTGYNTALGAAQSDKSAALQAAQGYSDLGSTAMQTNLAQAAAQVGAGTQQQSWDYQQYQNGLSYPFETTSWLANIAEGLGSGSGGTTTTTAPSGNTGSSVLGGILGIGSLFAKSDERFKEGVVPIGKTFDGQDIYRFRYKNDPMERIGLMAQDVEKVHPDAVAEIDGYKAVNYKTATDKAAKRGHFAQGGVIPYTSQSGVAGVSGNGMFGSYVPEMATSSPAPGRLSPPPAAQPNQQSSGAADGDKFLQQNAKSFADAIHQRYPNGVLAPSATSPSAAPVSLPATGPVPQARPDDGTVQPALASAPASGGVMSSIGNFFGFANGGVIRGYDDGGQVQPETEPFDASSISPEDILKLLATNTPVQSAGVAAPTAGGISAPDASQISQANFDDRFGPVNPGPRRIVGTDNLAAAMTPPGPTDVTGAISEAPTGNRSAPDAASTGVPGGVIPVPTPRPDHYTDPAVIAASLPTTPVGSAASPLPPPTDVKTLPVAGVVPQTAPSGVQKSYNVGNAQQMSPQFAKINSNYGLPDGYLNRTAYIESTFNPNANNGVSKGEFQFTNATAGQYGLKNPFDPLASADAAARLASDNAKFLTNGLGRPPTGGELYLAHQQGAAGALNLLSHPNAPATDIVGKQAVVGNGGSPNMTAGQFANLWVSKYNGASAGADSGGANATSAGSSGETPSGGVVPADDSASGVISSILNGQRPTMSDDMRMALLSAGLGMMAGTSRNFATNVGTGGQKGLETYMAKQQLNRENALAQSEIGYKKSDLGLRGQQVEIAGKQLALDAQKIAAGIGQTTADTAKTNLETQTGRYQQTVTPAGIIVRDMTDPNAPPKLTSWDDIQKNGPPSTVTGSNEAVGASVASGAAGNGNNGSTSPQSAGPVQTTPVAAPVSPVAAPTSASQPPSTAASASRPLFASNAPARVPIDPRVMSPTGQSIVQSETTDALKEARTEYQGAANSQTQLAEMKHDLGTLPNSTWTTPGTGFGARVQWAKAINTAVQGLGIQAPIDEQAVAAGEDLNKLTTRLGFELGKSMGSREAASIIDQSVSAVPGGANSPEGARRVIAGIEAVNQRKLDYYNFLQDWSAKTGGSIKGADDYFNTTNPPELYALTSYVPTPAMEYLRQHPDAAPDFDAKYGMGHNVSQYVLGGK